MTDKHFLTPPLELIREWFGASPVFPTDESWNYEMFMANEAARWGAATVLRAAADALVPATLYQTHWDRTVWETQLNLRRDLLSIADELDTDE
jgi:hypothetical protein